MEHTIKLSSYLPYIYIISGKSNILCPNKKTYARFPPSNNNNTYSGRFKINLVVTLYVISVICLVKVNKHANDVKITLIFFYLCI